MQTRRSLHFTARIVIVAVATSCGTSVAFGGQASFQGLGTLPGAIQSWAAGVSADGSTVVGWSYGGGSEGWRWKDGVMVGLGSVSSAAYGASADGSVVVGEMPGTTPPFAQQAFRWEKGVLDTLDPLPGGGFATGAHAVSADGSVVVGRTTNGRAFRSQGSVISEIPPVPGGITAADARGVSADASVIVGAGYSASGSEAFRWEGGILTGLGDLPGGSLSSEAYAVSADGSVIVGTSASSTSSYEAFRWQNGVMVGLGGFSGFFANRANGVSANGSVIVGAANSVVGAQPFIWDTAHGLRNLQDVFANELHVDISGWTLTVATGVSADGLTVVGYGYHGAGPVAWIAHLPEPGTLALLGLAIPVCIGRRRGRRQQLTGYPRSSVMSHRSSWIVMAVTAWSASVALGGQASFQGLGTLPGAIQSWAAGVSADGSTVVGWSYGGGSEGWRWKNGVMTGLGLPSSSAFGASADGSVVVGEMPCTDPMFLHQAFRLENGMISPLGFLPDGGFGQSAHAVSADGSVVVGVDTHGRAFRWERGAMSELPAVPGGINTWDARGVSADGSVVVGIGYRGSNWEAFRWENGVLTGLGALAPGLDSYAYGVSSDGSVVVGTSNSLASPGAGGAFRWQNGVMTLLTAGPGGISAATANAVSADGSVIVGIGYNGSASDAFLWDAAHGARSLRGLLVNDLHLNLSGWTLTEATGVSADGLTIVGYGYDNGHTEAWIAHLPEPGTLALLGMAIPMCLQRRRGRRL